MNAFIILSAKRMAAALTCSLCLFAFSSASATTVLGLDIDKVVADAEFVFEGAVINSETRQDSNSGIISTYVTFQINDIIKGDYSGDSIELKFMGGVFNGKIVQVSGMRIPEMAEQGVYFVESMSRDLINPLIGWSQGHFIIHDDNGTRRISTAGNQPVIEVEAVSAIPRSIKKPQSVVEGNTDIAAGVMTETSPIMIERALTVEDFKSRIADLLIN
ncbi:MAG: hypothetical protein QMC06_07430 [Gammaproteobacteria bacterium]|jgi:hypothetical protein|tara:strand:+ start:356 stop:1006 length:651 start_codon:yes stop_codon:yes gene_type:complete